MCLGCWKAEGRPFKVTDAVRSLAPRFGAADPSGPLHVVRDDWNLDDDNLASCMADADASDDEKALMADMLKISWEERWAVAILGDYPDFTLPPTLITAVL